MIHNSTRFLQAGIIINREGRTGMKTIIVASKNPVKIQAALSAFQKLFPGEQFQVASLSTPSGVNDQPSSDEETLAGALNRTLNAASAVGQADYWVGIEGGIEDGEQGMEAFAWIVVYGKNPAGSLYAGKGRTGTFFLPPPVADLVRQGKELGEADDIIFKRSNSKQENGAVGLLTGNVIDRQQFYEQAVILALIPFKNPTLYAKTVLE
jgi:inosine/xanthosine triphosphatase